jgi:peptide-methionine (S)-S-oxide reductase
MFRHAAVLGLLPTTTAFLARPATANTSFMTSRAIGSIMNLFGSDNKLIDPSKALPGRSQATPITENHYVLGNSLTQVPDGHKVAIFANGCFWGSEKGIWRMPAGIYSTAVGYCAGFTPNPTYQEVCSGQTGHTEGVRVVYNPDQVSFVDILRWFWEAHDPTSGMGQGNDRGTQYRSGFYYFDDEQKQLIEASKKAYEQQLGRPITTEIAAASDYDKVRFCSLVWHTRTFHLVANLHSIIF